MPTRRGAGVETLEFLTLTVIFFNVCTVFNSVKIIAFIAYKKLKPALGLDLGARHFTRF
jgi:hypothetical protein